MAKAMRRFGLVVSEPAGSAEHLYSARDGEEIARAVPVDV